MFEKNNKWPTKILVFDTETTGLIGSEIIELAYCIYDIKTNKVIEEFDTFVRVKDNLDEIKIDRLKADGSQMSVSELTGITNEMMLSGISQSALADIISSKFFNEDTMLAGYNLNFDLCMIKNTLERNGKIFDISHINCLDILTVFRDRWRYDKTLDENGQVYGHKLQSAVKRYKVNHKNTHRAIDDVLATLGVYLEMEKEEKISPLYRDNFSYYPKFADDLNRLEGISYFPIKSFMAKDIYYQIVKEYKEFKKKKSFIPTPDFVKNEFYEC